MKNLARAFGSVMERILGQEKYGAICHLTREDYGKHRIMIYILNHTALEL